MCLRRSALLAMQSNEDDGFTVEVSARAAQSSPLLSLLLREVDEESAPPPIVPCPTSAKVVLQAVAWYLTSTHHASAEEETSTLVFPAAEWLLPRPHTAPDVATASLTAFEHQFAAAFFPPLSTSANGKGEGESRGEMMEREDHQDHTGMLSHRVAIAVEVLRVAAFLQVAPLATLAGLSLRFVDSRRVARTIRSAVSSTFRSATVLDTGDDESLFLVPTLNVDEPSPQARHGASTAPRSAAPPVTAPPPLALFDYDPPDLGDAANCDDADDQWATFLRSFTAQRYYLPFLPGAETQLAIPSDSPHSVKEIVGMIKACHPRCVAWHRDASTIAEARMIATVWRETDRLMPKCDWICTASFVPSAECAASISDSIWASGCFAPGLHVDFSSAVQLTVLDSGDALRTFSATVASGLRGAWGQQLALQSRPLPLKEAVFDLARSRNPRFAAADPNTTTDDLRATETDAAEPWLMLPPTIDHTALDCCSSYAVSVDLSSCLSLDDLATQAFTGFSGRYLKLPLSIARIGCRCFASCAADVDLSHCTALTVIEAFAFCDFRRQTLRLPPAVTQVECGAFQRCLAAVNLQPYDGVDTLTEHVFEEFQGPSLALPPKLRHVQEAAFRGCTLSVDLSAQTNVIELPDWCFADYRGETVALPPSLQTIGVGCFARCTAAVDLSQCGELTVLAPGAFTGFCGADLQLPPRVTRLGHGCFSECSAVVDLSRFAIEVIPSQCFEAYAAPSLQLPPATGILCIGARAFKQCHAAVDLSTAPITEIPKLCFDGFHGSHLLLPSFISTLGVGAFTSCTAAVDLQHCAQLQEIPDQCFAAFCGSSITLPPSLRTIGACCFTHCKAAVDLSACVEITHVADYAFMKYASRSLALPPAIETVGWGAFARCKAAVDLTRCRSLDVAALPDGCFERCRNVMLPEVVTGAPNDAADDNALPDRAVSAAAPEPEMRGQETQSGQQE